MVRPWEIRRLENIDGPAWYVLEYGVVVSPPFNSEREAALWDVLRERI